MHLNALHVHHIATCELTLELSSGNTEIKVKLAFFGPNLTNDVENRMAPLTRCAEFRSYLWILTGAMGKICFDLCGLYFCRWS